MTLWRRNVAVTATFNILRFPYFQCLLDMPPSPPIDRIGPPQEGHLRFLTGRINYERSLSMPDADEAFKLDRMRALLQRLGDPQSHLPVIHVAGTKGKGSTAAMMAAVLAAAGYRTGLFTSPHLDRVEERIAVEGEPCSPQEFAALVEGIRPAVEALDRMAAQGDPSDQGPTYFESSPRLPFVTFSAGKWTWPCSKWDSAAGSIRPTSARP